MKPVVSSLFFMWCIAMIYATSQPVIRDTKAEGCVGDRCGPHCAWEDAKIFPGDVLNHPGKCRLLQCTDNFDIPIIPCPFDVTGQFEWVDKDITKLYPECCGTKTPRQQETVHHHQE